MMDNRDRFVDCCIYNDDGSPMPWVIYKIIHCIQNPRRACFLECRRKRRAIPDMYLLAPGTQTHIGPFVFDYMPLAFFDHHSVPITDDGTVSLATDMYYVDGVVHHVGYAFGYEDFARFHPIPSRNGAKGSGNGIVRTNEIQYVAIRTRYDTTPCIPMQWQCNAIGCGTRHAQLHCMV